MQRYKIGQVSKMLNVPVETIRFLEQKGLISPEKDTKSGYRYYNIWDVNHILDYQRYRHFGFSSKSAVVMVKNSQLEHLTGQLAAMEQEAEALAKLYAAKMEKLKNFHTVLENAPKMVGKYLIMTCPENYSLFLRYRNAGGLQISTAEETEGSYNEFMQYYSFVEHIYRIKSEWLEHPLHYHNAQWGLTMKKRWVDTLHIRLLPHMEYNKAATSIFTVIPVGERQYFSADLLEGAFHFMEKNHYQLNGDITGIYIATVQEVRQAIRYMEIWIPIKSVEYPIPEESEFVPLRQILS